MPEPAASTCRSKVGPSWRGVFGVAIIVITVAGCAAGGPASRSRESAGSPSVGKTITIDPQVGDTFAPPPASARPRLTARQAWARYMRQLGYPHHTALPPRIHAQLGLLTLPIGPGGSGPYTAHNELTYGYSTPNGCTTTNPRVMFPPVARCIRWDFLNANTGNQIESTWQEIGHWQVLTDFNAMFPGLRFALAFNGKAVPYPDNGTIPSYHAHPGEHLLITVVVTVPRHLLIKDVRLDISRGNWSTGPKGRLAGVHPITIHSPPLSAGVHTFELHWRVPASSSGTSCFLVLSWSIRNPPGGLAGAIAQLAFN